MPEPEDFDADDFEPLPLAHRRRFRTRKNARFRLPLRYSDIDWRDESQRDGYILFVIWFLEQLLEGGLTLEGQPETPETAAIRAQLDQLHAEMRENALLAGLDVTDSPAPFAELDAEEN